MPRPLIAAAALAILAATPLALTAQSTPRPTCDAPEFRQFDFWIGDWDVTAGGQPAGTNLVTLEEDGCVVHEHWTGAGGGTGQSFNYYDRGDGKWHQMWVSNSGNVLALTGSYADGTLAMQGDRPGRGGTTVTDRITFRHNDDGTVRQLWTTSTDGGKTWQPGFDGLYRRRAPR